MKEVFAALLCVVSFVLVIISTYNIGKGQGSEEVYKHFTSLCSDKVAMTLDREFVELEFSCKVKEKK